MRAKHRKDGNHVRNYWNAGPARYNRAKAKRVEKPEGAERSMASKRSATGSSLS